VNSQKNEAQENLGKVQEAFRQREAQWQQFAQGVQQQQQITQQQTQEPTSTEPDGEELYIKQMLGDDETGSKVYEMLDRHFNHKIGKQGVASKDEIMGEVRDYVNKQTGSIQSTFHVSNQVQDMVGKGMIGPEDAERITGKVASALQSQPQWAENPANMDLLMSKIVMDEIKAGQVKPYSQRRTMGSNTPVAPGQNGNSNQAREAEQGNLRSAASRFRSLRGLVEKNDMKTLERLGRNTAGDATGQDLNAMIKEQS
tara:strand:+ start:214 stop:981 length:768 start_codon:yes stop_codon:yes gene_type:complete